MDKVVLWSGGFDSTKALIDTICDSHTDNVLVISLVADCTGTYKNIRESEAREKIKDYISSQVLPFHKDVIVNYETIVINWKDWDAHNNGGLSHPVLWTLSALPSVPVTCELIFSYINGDQAPIYRKELTNIVKSAAVIMNKVVEPVFPLVLYSKAEIIQWFMEFHPDLLEICTSCEGTLGRCGHCMPCNHLMTALVEIIMGGTTDYQEVARQKLLEWFGINVSAERSCENKEKECEVCD